MDNYDEDKKLENLFAYNISRTFDTEESILKLAVCLDTVIENIDPMYHIEYEDLIPLLSLKVALSTSMLDKYQIENGVTEN